MVSVIVPTFNESGNVEPLTARLHAALGSTPHEIVFIDDSTDGTDKVIAALAARDSAVRFLHREQQRGLGTAVLRGIELAQGEVIAVMDADLQHPPELLPSMVATLAQGPDVVIASRFVPGGGDPGLNPLRRGVSAVARYMARLSLQRVRRVADPTSGYFVFKRTCLQGVQLDPRSWKILIDLLVRARVAEVREVPLTFAKRLSGTSKMSGREVMAYVRHLALLVATSREDRRFFLFASVGVLGVGVNLGIYTQLVGWGLPVTESGFFSAAGATLFNFVLNDNITWRDAREDPMWKRLGKFATTSFGGVAVNVAILAGLYRGLSVNYLLANLVGIAASVFCRFYFNNSWTWRRGGTPAAAQGEASRDDSVAHLVYDERG